MRLKVKVVLLAVIPLMASLALIAWAVTRQARDLAGREQALVVSATMAAKEAELQNYLALALSTISPLYESHRDDAAIRTQALSLLGSLYYNGSDGYFFVFDAAGRALLHPRQPELVGKNLWDLHDVNGVPVVRNLIAQAHQGGGAVRYVWQKPSNREQTPKLAYVVALPRWNWVLGTGVYLDDVQATLAQQDRQLNANIVATMAWIAGIAVLGIALIGVCSLVLNLSESRVAEAKLRLLARQVVQSQEAERAHLSRELHDSTSQTLVSIKLLLESAIAHLGEAVPPALPRALERLKGALGEVRQISHRLRPAELDMLGLPAALEHLGQEFAQHSRMTLNVRVRGEARELPDEIKTVLFRVTQDALTNIEKHAGASRVAIWLSFGRRGLRLRITDNGTGFDVGAVRQDPRRGIGLRNMRERLASIGAHIAIDSRPGHTQVVADVPLASLRRFSMEAAA